MHVASDEKRPVINKKPRGKYVACIYPGIDTWLRSHNTSLLDFSHSIKLSYAHIYRIMAEEVSPTKRTIDKILRATGMTYEEAFGDPRKEHD